MSFIGENSQYSILGTCVLTEKLMPSMFPRNYAEQRYIYIVKVKLGLWLGTCRLLMTLFKCWWYYLLIYFSILLLLISNISMSLNWEMSVKLFTTNRVKKRQWTYYSLHLFWREGRFALVNLFFSCCDVSSTIVCLFTLPLDIVLCLSLFNLAAVHLSECLYQDRIVND